MLDSLRDATGGRVAFRDARPVGGGCINAAYRLETDAGRFFVKLHAAAQSAMFAAEAAGLEALAAADAVRVPVPVCRGTAGDRAFLVLEHLDLRGGDRDSAARLGRDLAALHATTADAFGWDRDNTLGSTPQPNGRDADWVRFWRERRLGHQLDLAASRGHRFRGADRLLDRLDALLAGHAPEPSLLHGDLWGGNWAALADGTPVVFDPAVYHGDREADLAMTELFGGFDPAFHAAYREAAPLDDGYPLRRDLYNLYHVLNHVNLFGGGYAGQAQRLVDRLLAAA
ncbi:MAG: fructosamine kinase family protein [Gammaproteobacteria bacterium]|nr:fructosamine kinase family protein [Gammaproteobacteria bacterium]